MAIMEDSSFGFVGEFSSFDSYAVHAINAQVDAVLISLHGKKFHALETIRCVKKNCPNTRVIVLAESISQDLFEAIAIGADNYLSMDVGAEELCKKLQKMIKEPLSIQFMMNNPVGIDSCDDKRFSIVNDWALTDREQEIHELIVNGHNNKDIASKLGISLSTTKTHVRRIFLKMGVHSRLEIVAIKHQKHDRFHNDQGRIMTLAGKPSFLIGIPTLTPI